MIKMLALFKKRSDMTLEEFKNAYETTYAPLAKPHLAEPKKYIRRYVEPVNKPLTGSMSDSEFDVITEMWFETWEDYEALNKRLHEGEVHQLLLPAQKKVFGDIVPTLVYVTEECETDLS